MLSDALLLSGQVDEARDALVRGIKMNEEALKRPGLPEFLRLDVSGANFVRTVIIAGVSRFRCHSCLC